jgi:hypothetical protein
MRHYQAALAQDGLQPLNGGSGNWGFHLNIFQLFFADVSTKSGELWQT